MGLASLGQLPRVAILSLSTWGGQEGGLRKSEILRPMKPIDTDAVRNAWERAASDLDIEVEFNSSLEEAVVIVQPAVVIVQPRTIIWHGDPRASIVW